MEIERIGKCTLYRGECLDILSCLGQFDAVITDPPYGVKENAHKVKSRGKLAKITDYGDFDWDSKPASKEQINACIAAGTEVIIFGGNYFHVPPARGWLVWDKENSGDFADCELAWTNIETAVRIFRHMWNGMLRASERDTQRVHPTQKPVKLMQWCITQCKKEPQTICDPFMGSGTTGVACAKMGRSFTGIELDKRYFDIACERITAAYAQGDLFIDPA